MTESHLLSLLNDLHEADARMHASPWGSPEFEAAAAKLAAIQAEILAVELVGELVPV